MKAEWFSIVIGIHLLLAFLTGATLLFAQVHVYAQPSCQSSDLKLKWPVEGTPYRDWVVPFYMDLEPGEGKRDYTGASGNDARTYDQHRGIDIVVPTFKWVDDGFPVYAAAGGEVVDVRDGEEDRNIVHDSGKRSNYVELRHANGFSTIYAHLKKGSANVSIGDSVTTGQYLGAMGSSGYSSWPHLHFEVRDCESSSFSSMAENMWLDAPAYATPFSVLNLALRRGTPDDNIRHNVVSSGTSAHTFRRGEIITVITIISGGGYGDSIMLEAMYPDGGPRYKTFERVIDRQYGGSFWYWYFALPDDYSGAMDISIRLNEKPAASETIRVM